MFDFFAYRTTCNELSQLLRKGRGGIYLGDYEILGTNAFGQQLIADSRHAPSLRTLYVPPAVEVSVLALMLHLVKSGMTCADVGAGCGYYTIFLASILGPHGKIYSFESIPECFSLIKKNCYMNDMNQTIVCVDKLVSDGTKTVEQEYFGGNYEFFFLKQSEHQQKKITVETVSLDHYFEGKESCIDFIKINLEEDLSAIFRGLTDTARFNSDLKIICQFHKEKIIEKGDDPKDFFELIKQMNFEMYRLPTLEPTSEEELMYTSGNKPLLLARK